MIEFNISLSLGKLSCSRQTMLVRKISETLKFKQVKPGVSASGIIIIIYDSIVGVIGNILGSRLFEAFSTEDNSISDMTRHCKPVVNFVAVALSIR